MYERFTERARKVMFYANQEAQRLNYQYIGTEHILLGLIREKDGIAVQVLQALDIGLGEIIIETELRAQKNPNMLTQGLLPNEPKVKYVIQHATEESRKMDHNFIGTEHLLLGLLHEQKGVAAQVLEHFGVTYSDAREKVLELLGHGNPTKGFTAMSGTTYILTEEQCSRITAERVRQLLQSLEGKSVTVSISVAEQ